MTAPRNERGFLACFLPSLQQDEARSLSHFRILLILSFGHMVTDLNQGMLPALLPFLKEAFQLSFTLIGLLVLVANISSSTLQPFIGYWSDKVPTRWLLPAGIFLACAGIGLLGISTSFPLMLLAVLISGIGVALYHPEGSKTAHYVSGNRKGSAMALFSIGGNLGMGFGPPLVMLFLAFHGISGTLWMAVIGAITALLFWGYLPILQRECPPIDRTQKGTALDTSQILPVFLLILVVTFRSWLAAALTVYIPLYYIIHLMGNPFFGNTLLTIFLISGAVGTLLGGPIADKIGPRRAILGSMALMIPLVFLIFNTSGFWLVLAVAAAGMVLISSFATTIVMAQMFLPNNIGVASGLMTGFGIGMGGVGLIPLGFIADTWGILIALKVIMILPILSTLLAYILPNPSTGLATPATN
jgi:FSR family fosmidomycin resistance protein-like MFS transporter